MFIDLNLWRARIGIHAGNIKCISFLRQKGMKLKSYFVLQILLQIFLCYFTMFVNIFNVNLLVTICKNSFSSILIGLICLRHIYISYLLLICGDIECNPDPKLKDRLSFCYWNIIVYLHIIFPKFLYYRHSTPFTNLILFVFLNLILILQFILMT